MNILLKVIGWIVFVVLVSGAGIIFTGSWIVYEKYNYYSLLFSFTFSILTLSFVWHRTRVDPRLEKNLIKYRSMGLAKRALHGFGFLALLLFMAWSSFGNVYPYIYTKNFGESYSGELVAEKHISGARHDCSYQLKIVNTGSFLSHLCVNAQQYEAFPSGKIAVLFSSKRSAAGYIVVSVSPLNR